MQQDTYNYIIISQSLIIEPPRNTRHENIISKPLYCIIDYRRQNRKASIFYIKSLTIYTPIRIVKFYMTVYKMPRSRDRLFAIFKVTSLIW